MNMLLIPKEENLHGSKDINWKENVKRTSNDQEKEELLPKKKPIHKEK